MGQTETVSRRGFLRTAAGATAVAGAATTTASAQDGRPDFGGWLDGVDGGFRDARGEGEVTVEVGASGNSGAFAFSPAGLWVDPGTTIVWEWTGQGGGHNVSAQDGADFGSEISREAGNTFEHTFEDTGVVTYQCDPHVSLGMKGAVAVGDDVPTAGGGGGGNGSGGGGGGGSDGGDAGGADAPPVPGEPALSTSMPALTEYVGMAAIGFLVVSTVAMVYMTVIGHDGGPTAGDSESE